MKINGKCDLCGKKGDWEGGLFRSKQEARKRPPDFSALYPLSPMPKDCTFRPEDLEKHNIYTHFVCPDCFR